MSVGYVLNVFSQRRGIRHCLPLHDNSDAWFILTAFSYVSLIQAEQTNEKTSALARTNFRQAYFILMDVFAYRR